MSPSDFRLSYTAQHRVLRVRFLMYLSLLFLSLMSFVCAPLVEMFRTGVEPNGDPISRAEVAALMAISQLAGWAFVVGMHIYGRCYVVGIFTAANGEEKVYETVGWLGRVRWFVSEDEERACRCHRGKTRGFYSVHSDVTVMAVDAPYYTQRVRSRRLPFIIDASGSFIEAPAPPRVTDS